MSIGKYLFSYFKNIIFAEILLSTTILTFEILTSGKNVIYPLIC